MKRYWLGLGIWGAGLVLVWWLSKGNWQVVSAVATWFLVLGVAYAFLQVQQARKSTNAQLTVGLFEKLRSDEMLRILRETIYDNDRETLRSFSTGDKTAEVEKIGHVLDWLDILGVLARKDIVDRDLAIMGFAGATAVRCWYKLVYFTRKMQSKRGFYNENYEDFVHRCIEIFKKDKIEVYMKGIDGDLVKLIQELPEDLRPRSLEAIKRDRQTGNKDKEEV